MRPSAQVHGRDLKIPNAAFPAFQADLRDLWVIIPGRMGLFGGIRTQLWITGEGDAPLKPLRAPPPPPSVSTSPCLSLSSRLWFQIPSNCRSSGLLPQPPPQPSPHPVTDTCQLSPPHRSAEPGSGFSAPNATNEPFLSTAKCQSSPKPKSPDSRARSPTCGEARQRANRLIFERRER